MQADGGLRVNSSRRQQVAALTLQERKKAEMAIRRDIAAMQIAETEERIMLAEGTRVEQAKLAHQAEEAHTRPPILISGHRIAAAAHAPAPLGVCTPQCPGPARTFRKLS